MRKLVGMIVAVALLLGCIPGMAGVASAANGGSISGVVHELDGVTPIQGVLIYALYYDAWNQPDGIETGADGSYTISGLEDRPTGYRILAEADGYLSECWEETPDWGLATPVMVGETGINFTLAPGASITGHVYRADGVTPIQGASVELWENATAPDGEWRYSNSRDSDESGAYTISMNVLPGAYKLKAAALGYIAEYYDDQPDVASADPVWITGTEEETGIDFSLTLGGRISGRVRENFGSNLGIAGAVVTAVDNATQKPVTRAFTEGAESPEPGFYDLGYSLTPADYMLKIEAEGYVTEYWNNVTDNTLATLITIGSGTWLIERHVWLQNEGPRVTTGGATGVASSSATVSGTLLNLGLASSAEVSFEYGLTTAYGSTTTAQTMNGTGAFSATISGLTPGNTYYYRAKAVGGSYDPYYYPDDGGTFTTLGPPSVTTENATSVAGSSATLVGNLTAKGTSGDVVVFFEYGTAPGEYTLATDNQTRSVVGTFTRYVSSLTANTPYYYRAVAVAGGETVYGAEMTFTTPPVPPKVTTDNATDVLSTSASLNGTLVYRGTDNTVNVSFEWKVSGGTTYVETAVEARTKSGAFTFDLAGLTPGTTYTFRAKADGAGDPVFGDEKTFTTPVPPTVATSDATGVATAAARLNGNLTAKGSAGSVNVSFEWKVSGGTYTGTAVVAQADPGVFFFDLTGLTAGTTYYFRAKAEGDGEAVYGEEKTFTTTDVVAPVISAVKDSAITDTGATITWTTNEGATSQVEYGPSDSYGSTTTLDSNKVTSHSVNLTGLKAGTTYHYRVKSQDAAGNEAVSKDGTFKTTGSSGGGMPVWAWVLIGLAAVAVLGGGGFFAYTKLAKK